MSVDSFIFSLDKPTRPGSGFEPTLGLAMIMKNEANNLQYSLGPLVGVFDEIVVVDTGSRDQSPELAASYGAKVLHLPWPDDFSLARNFGLERMQSDFIMWLDADNSVTQADVNALRDALRSDGLIFLATEVVVPQGDRLLQKRVFANSPECRFQGRVHEQLVHPPDWPVRVTRAEIRHWGYADAVLARQKGERNLELLLDAPETAEGDFYHLYQLGRTLHNLRHFGEAEECLRQAVEAGFGESCAETGPVNPSLWNHAVILLSQARQRLGKTDEAEEALHAFIRLRPAYGPAKALLGRLLYEQGRFEECALFLRQALALGCGDPSWGADPARCGFTAACQLAKALEKIGKFREAGRAWEEAARHNPENPEPWVALAEHSMTAGNAELAKHLLEKAIKLAPAHRRAKQLEASL
ncbi:MAG: glycosyltransferase [Deltaproteobacteria bacterium]|jgi:tetratricopeptide (TPR) repeat protein|nr:glycosyltransferase [Deltaproteobacteria bacterium]